MNQARFLVDLRSAQAEATWERGLRRWVRGLADELTRRPDRCAGLLMDPNGPPPRGLGTRLATSPYLRWNTATDVRAVVEADAAGAGPVVYVVASPFEHQPPVGHVRRNWFVPDHVAAHGLPVIGVLHDLIPMEAGESFASAALRQRFAEHARLVARLDHLVTNSEHTRVKAIELLDLDPAGITTVGTGVDPHLLGGRADSTIAGRQWGDDGRPVVLCVGGDDPRKNVAGLVTAWGQVPPGLRDGRRLLIVSRAQAGTLDAWRAAAASAGLDDDEVHVATEVDDDGLIAAYEAADLVVMPSHDEGFGLPVAEAVAMGRPVVTASTGALPEILDLPESTFDPADTADMARVIGAALDGTSLRQRLVDRAVERRVAVTWATVADRLADVGDDLVRRRPTRRRVRRRRVALVGPLPPAASGIADHNHRLLAALAELVDLEAFVPGDARAARAQHPDVPVYAAADLQGRIDPHGYDAVICCLGNSSGHEDTLAVCRRLPTVLWLHEVRLPALYLAHLHGRPDAADRAIPVLRRFYPNRAPETTARELGWSVQGYADAGLAMTSGLAAGARGVLVSSSLAARMLALDQPAHRPLPPTFVTPLAAPVPGPPVPMRRGSEPIELVAVGVVAHHKVPERLIDATAILRAQGRSVRTTFVGPVPELYADELRVRIAREGVVDCVVLAGQVPRDDYDRHLAEADVAVQLRRSSYGETSAAVLDALAAGVPVVTNLPSAAELPDGTVELLPPDAAAADVAAAVAALADDPARRDARRRAGRAYAASRPPAVLAAEVLAALESIQRSTSTP